MVQDSRGIRIVNFTISLALSAGTLIASAGTPYRLVPAHFYLCICGMTKGPRRHKETWWWNEEVAEAVREKKIKYGKWKKENTKEAKEGV